MKVHFCRVLVRNRDEACGGYSVSVCRWCEYDYYWAQALRRLDGHPHTQQLLKFLAEKISSVLGRKEKACEDKNTPSARWACFCPIFLWPQSVGSTWLDQVCHWAPRGGSELTPHAYDDPEAILRLQRLCLHKRIPASSLSKKSSSLRGQLRIRPHTHCPAGYSHPTDRTNATLTLQVRTPRPSKVKQHAQGY